MKVVAIIQARTGSTRLPGKVLKPILGEPMLAHMLERVKRAEALDAVIVATTANPHDDPVAELAAHMGVRAFRGSEDDVLDRFYRAAKEAQADVVVRLTGDCPLMDPMVIDEVIKRFVVRKVDYTSTPRNYPEGLDCEVFSFAALERAWHEALVPSEREHVTQYIQKHPELFVLDERWAVGTRDDSSMHWSVDSPQDFAFVVAVFERLYPQQADFGMCDVLALLEREPALRDINPGGTGYEGLEKSKREDARYALGRLVLGTVELGMAYGIDGAPQPDRMQAFEILDAAHGAGINTFDTAAGYGNAEELVGEWLAARGLGGKINVISKGLGRADIEASLKHLGLQSIDGYLLHNIHGSLEELKQAQRAGLVAHIGASVYEPEEVASEYEYVQVPYNVFDRRFENVRSPSIFARSPFLQGLLLMQPDTLPAHMVGAKPQLAQFIEICGGYGLTQLQGALLFALYGWPVARVVFGVKTRAQLEEIIAATRLSESLGFIEAIRQIPPLDRVIIDPRAWKK